MSTAEAMISVNFLAVPETTPGAIYSLHELLGSVGRIWHHLTGEAESASGLFTPHIVSRDGQMIRSPTGLPIAVEAALDQADAPDVVIVTDLAVPVGEPHGRWQVEIAWLRAQHDRGALICSICTGALLLAEAGLLDGREATSHWSVAPVFRTAYPKVKLRPERIICPSGDGHRIVTAGGASSWSDLGLYLIARYSGETEARRMSKVFVIGDKSDGQLPFAAMARPRQHADNAVSKAQLWIAENYTAINPVSRMAEVAGLSERTFSRRFRKATGYGPVEYVQALRLEEAKQMLETTTEPTDAVAIAVGYADPVFFRRLFKRDVGVTPARYRQRFAEFRPERGTGKLLVP